MMSDKDFQPMESYLQKWRWEPNRCAIAPEELKQIRPLSPVRANEVWERSIQFVDGKSTDFRPSSDLFPTIIENDIRGKDIDEVQQWLTARIKQEEKPIIVSWQPDWAVLTDWSIFLKFWDDFCYPGSDDVSIWPVSGKWLLHYWHEESFYFAT